MTTRRSRIGLGTPAVAPGPHRTHRGRYPVSGGEGRVVLATHSGALVNPIPPAQRFLDSLIDRRLYASQRTALTFVVPTLPPYVDPDLPPVAGVGAPPVGLRAIWQTPIFDMAPQLGGTVGTVPGASPIVAANGLMVEIAPDAAVGGIRDLTQEIRVYSVTYTAAVASQTLRPNNRWRDITQDFTNGNTSAVLQIPWPSPARFWSWRLVFDVYGIDDPAQMPVLFAQGTML
jgi:hypothetical protein